MMALLLFTATTFSQEKLTNMSDNFMLVIHGGAGTILKKNMTDEKEKLYRDKLNEALQAGHKILKEGGTAVDAVEATINLMENSPLFNAGKGSVFTNAGTNEMDASIMDGKTLNAGAVAGVKTIKNPISAARIVMEKSPHVMLSGDGADQYAKEMGVETASPDYFKDSIRYRQWLKLKETEKQQLDHDATEPKGNDGIPEEGNNIDPSEIEFNINIDEKYGTVGCVALDRHGNLAAGTSTGGMTNKRWGRIGDSPVIAAGTYANNKTCAVSCTGHGEYFIRNVVAYDISAHMEYKSIGVDEAAKQVIHKKLNELGGTGGVIVLDAQGNFTMQFNTAGMYRGYMKANGESEVMLYKGND